MNSIQTRIAATLACLLATAPLAVQAQATPDLAATAAKEKGATVLPSGLVFQSIKEGSGPKPAATDTVRVHYRGVLADGKEFDSSIARGQPAEFPLNRVIPCWTEGVQRIQVGGKAKLTCPPGIAYGARGAGGVIPPNATLQFEVELLGIAGK
ncbi:MAG: FKBP-type peptidyl-prolyl cis-trans isomerase [Aquincola tertiaricarbonis]|uniref:FKBP-type peptidyl-prolyl cis-trans isomerase n=1 Tax=Aquincola TaxID=391952 RepID=UPI000614A646|nr:MULTISPECIES: FKBP-type peptidyl-prolyl cis-trans isomerase [Aquincola]MCR5868257.1 FKBP-type peptidyl-prolyl cis-trans isomerase [Aquincola sp. J276]